MTSDADHDGVKAYEQFLLEEYRTIASAYFNTMTSIATFFRYYLLIVSIPVPLFVLLKGESVNTGAINAAVTAYAPLVLSLLAFVGLFVMVYLAKLRFDAVTYARTVNGVREYFTKRAGLSESEELLVRVLPRQLNTPGYLNREGFLCIMATLALVNSVYFAASVHLTITTYCSGVALEATATSIAFVGFAVGSLSIYYLLARAKARQPSPRDQSVPPNITPGNATPPKADSGQDPSE